MRYDEDFYENMNHAIDDLYEKVIKVIGNSEYVLFGHSMGLSWHMNYVID